MARPRLIRILWAVDLGLFATALVAFLAQGGFGRGHGLLDPVIGVLALPWALLPWPEAFLRRDIMWLVLIPFALNSAVIATVQIVGLIRSRRV